MLMYSKLQMLYMVENGIVGKQVPMQTSLRFNDISYNTNL